ncbi:hypothetical protein E2C01_024905 [Portunus trituberculatus]|uniref:Uncharacterized protein n=1 Tax=Portunus trituberculatus TaxID=210409 RepID=A0A5B7EBY9_PORTR|nr:hypothetical protein [Portunus trituberculatus]
MFLCTLYIYRTQLPLSPRFPGIARTTYTNHTLEPFHLQSVTAYALPQPLHSTLPASLSIPPQKYASRRSVFRVTHFPKSVKETVTKSGGGGKTRERARRTDW